MIQKMFTMCTLAACLMISHLQAIQVVRAPTTPDMLEGGNAKARYTFQVDAKHEGKQGVVIVSSHLEDVLPGWPKPVQVVNRTLCTTTDPVEAVTCEVNTRYEGERFACDVQFSDDEVERRSFCPFPIFKTDDKGHRIEISVMHPEAEHYSVSLSGYKPDEILELHSTSAEEYFSQSFSYYEQMAMTWSPAVMGQYRGLGTYEIRGKDSQLAVNVVWGDVVPMTKRAAQRYLDSL